MSQVAEKDLAYYMSLPYKIHIGYMEDGSFYAHYYELGRAVAHGDGATVEEAIKEATVSKELLFEDMLEDGDAIPEPSTYSGRFQVRLPKSLHRALAQEAEREGVSLNMLVVSKLSR